MTTAPAPRLAARVLLVDAQDRVLLMEWEHPTNPERGTWWITPGGGLDPGEDYRAGALRELFEETGLVLAGDSLTGPVHERDVDTDIDGILYRQHEEFFVARIDAHVVDTSGFTALEVACVRGYRWWTLAELDVTAERLSPPDLPALLRKLA